MPRTLLPTALLATLVAWSPGMAVAQATATELSAQIDAAQREASKLSPKQIYDEIERLRTILSIKRQNGQSLFAMDADTTKQIGYAQELKRQREASDPEASFHYAMYNVRVCGGLQSANMPETSKVVSDCWHDSMESFKVASKGGRGTASFNVGRMYELGWGVTPSKFVAADWYVKAADQHNSAGAREDALTALEAALKAVPDHPAALRLKATMLR